MAVHVEGGIHPTDRGCRRSQGHVGRSEVRPCWQCSALEGTVSSSETGGHLSLQRPPLPTRHPTSSASALRQECRQDAACPRGNGRVLSPDERPRARKHGTGKSQTQKAAQHMSLFPRSTQNWQTPERAQPGRGSSRGDAHTWTPIEPWSHDNLNTQNATESFLSDEVFYVM